jgi:5'-phosphate synthase pdxT subunit
MLIGILALQGAFREHEILLDGLHATHFQIRQRKDLDRPFDGLILPGGESTVMTKLLHDLDLFGPIANLIAHGFPVFGTCAGLLLLAKEIDNHGKLCFQSMAIKAIRNAYGRQLGSFNCTETFADIGPVPMVFIRAPYIQSVSGDAKVLAICQGRIVAAREGNQLATAFHPELASDLSVHRYFLSICQEHTNPKKQSIV